MILIIVGVYTSADEILKDNRTNKFGRLIATFFKWVFAIPATLSVLGIVLSMGWWAFSSISEKLATFPPWSIVIIFLLVVLITKK